MNLREEKCWFIDEEKTKTSNDYHCTLCNEIFNLPYEFFKHRKIYHEETVPECKNYKNGECSYGQEKRWFKHDRNDENIVEKENRMEENLVNDEIVQKIFKMMETMTKRINCMEKKIILISQNKEIISDEERRSNYNKKLQQINTRNILRIK